MSLISPIELIKICVRFFRMKYLFSFVFLFLPLLISFAQEPAALRKQSIERELAYQRTRLNKVPQNLDEIRKTLRGIQQNYGITGHGVLMRVPDDLPHLIENRPIHPDTIDTLVALDRYFQQTGTDLIVVPVPNQVMVYTHLLDSASGPDANMWPAYTKGLIQLLESGVEVIDLNEAFSSYTGEGHVLHTGDHHWSSAGMAIATDKIMERLNRYPHLQQYASGKDSFRVKTQERGVQQSLLSFNKLWSSRKKRGAAGTYANAIEMTGIQPKETLTHFQYKGEFPLPGYDGKTRSRKNITDMDPDLFLFGDSMVFHMGDSPVSGMGIVNHLGHAVGRPLSFYGQSGGAAGAPMEYAKRFAPMPTNPKVVIMIMRAGPMAASEGRKVWKVPPFDEVAAPERPAKDIGGFAGTAKVKLTELSPLPDPDTADYENSLLAVEVEFVEEPHQGERAKVYLVGMWKRRLNPKAVSWKEGQTLTLRLSPWAQAREAKNLGSIMRNDDISNLLLPELWADFQ